MGSSILGVPRWSFLKFVHNMNKKHVNADNPTADLM